MLTWMLTMMVKATSANSAKAAIRMTSTAPLVDNVPPGRVDEGSVAGEYQWAAMHDDTYLYLMVFGEQVGAELLSDSGFFYDDDNLNIFIDGDNSKSSSYDGVNDYHILIPLLESDGSGNHHR